MPDDSPRDPATLERARLDADRRYNDALTAVDRAIVRPAPIASTLTPPETTVPPLPGGWRRPLARVIDRWLSPFFTEQHTFNTRVAHELAALAGREREATLAHERFQTAVIVFLQQITAFVDTKLRALDAVLQQRLDAQERAIAATSEVAAEVQTLQRTAQLLKRLMAEGAEKAVGVEKAETDQAEHVGESTHHPGPSTWHSANAAYVGFEDRFRGSDQQIRDKQSAYLPVFAGTSNVLDIGCGRGEFLTLLRDHGIPGRGIDVNGDMVAVARERGLDVSAADALEYVSGLADESLGGVLCSQVVEHLEPQYLVALLDTLSHKLRPGAPIVIETINPACWLAFFSSYIRDLTHVRPIHPDTLEYLLHASGFSRVSIQYSSPVPEAVKMKPVAVASALRSSADPTAQTLAKAADVVNENGAILNGLLFTFMDYAGVAYRS